MCTSVGPFISLLVSSGVGKYMEFKLLEKLHLVADGRVIDVPSHKGDIFKSKDLPPLQKRALMKFLKVCGVLQGSLVTTCRSTVPASPLGPMQVLCQREAPRWIHHVGWLAATSFADGAALGGRFVDVMAPCGLDAQSQKFVSRVLAWDGGRHLARGFAEREQTVPSMRSPRQMALGAFSGTWSRWGVTGVLPS